MILHLTISWEPHTMQIPKDLLTLLLREIFVIAVSSRIQTDRLKKILQAMEIAQYQK